jgi:hypothetical protein
MKALLKILLALLPIALGVSGCVGSQSFTTAARQGDTVQLPVGWQKKLSRENVTITITPSSGSPITYLPGDPKVRAIINLYPDPVSRAVVGSMTNQSLGYDGNFTGNTMINQYVTFDATSEEHDNDWWQTTLFLDLPPVLPEGPANILIQDSAGAAFQPIKIDILPGTGSSNIFGVRNASGGIFPLLTYWPQILPSMERADRYTVTIKSYTDPNGYWVIPHSVQLRFTHTPDVGKTWVINPRGDIKNVAWNDNGTNITVMLMPTRRAITQLLDFKFYIAGGITGLTQSEIKAYDVNGNLMSGITAQVE